MRGFMAKKIEQKEVETTEAPTLSKREKILIARKRQLQRQKRSKLPNILK